MSHWLLGPAWGRRLGARPGGTFYISCPCQALRQPEQPPTSPWIHPSSAEPGLSLGDCTLPKGLLPPCCFLKLTRFPEQLWGGKKQVSVSVTGKQVGGRGHFLALLPHPDIL